MKTLEKAPEAVMLPVDEVVNLHNYVMGDVREQHIQRRRRIYGQDGLYKFCMLDRSDDLPSDDTGTVDTYFSMRLNKVRPRYWSMLIGFREGINSRATATTNFLTIYRMDWTRTLAMGIMWRRMTIAGETPPVQIVKGQLLDPSKMQNDSLQAGNEVSYIQPDDLTVIRERIQDVTDAISRTVPTPNREVAYSSSLADELV